MLLVIDCVQADEPSPRVASVSPKTRQKVEETAASLGYRPNQWARSLIKRRSNLIGVVAPSMEIAQFLLAGSHRQLAFIAGKESSSTSRDRERGFVDTLQRLGHPVPQRAVGIICAQLENPDTPAIQEVARGQLIVRKRSKIPESGVKQGPDCLVWQPQE